MSRSHGCGGSLLRRQPGRRRRRLRLVRRRRPARCGQPTRAPRVPVVGSRRLKVWRAIRIRWPWHLVAWTVAATPAVLLGGWPWLAAGPAGFEVLLLAVGLRARQVRPAGGNGGRPDGPWGAGDREPRRPLPVAGAGSAALPLPTEQWYAKPGLTS